MAKRRSLAERDHVMHQQLELQLGEPWGGYSPRVLTKAFLARRLRAEGMGRLDQDASHVGDIEEEELGQLLLPFFKEV